MRGGAGRKWREAAERSAERRRREDEAPRLRAVHPGLESLRLEIEERKEGVRYAEAAHIRRVVVEHAPALFLVTCGDPSCREGGHDLTDIVLTGLRSGATTFEGEDACGGQTGQANCQRVVRVVAVAAYRP